MKVTTMVPWRSREHPEFVVQGDGEFIHVTNRETGVVTTFRCSDWDPLTTPAYMAAQIVLVEFSNWVLAQPHLVTSLTSGVS